MVPGVMRQDRRALDAEKTVVLRVVEALEDEVPDRPGNERPGDPVPACHREDDADQDRLRDDGPEDTAAPRPRGQAALRETRALDPDAVDELPPRRSGNERVDGFPAARRVAVGRRADLQVMAV